jgi:hypothetical protein
MKRAILAVAVVVGLADPQAARAQVFVGPVYGGGVVSGRGLGSSYHRHKFRAFGFAGVYSSRWWLGYPPARVLPPFSVITPFGFSPGFLGPGWGAPPVYGWNPVWGTRFFGPAWDFYVAPQPPVIVLPPPIILAGRNNGLPGGNGGGVIPPDDPPPMPVNAANFLVIEPKKPALPPPGQVVPAVDRVAKADHLPLLPPPRPERDPFAPPRGLLPRDAADADPAKEALRQTRLGREAFAGGEYGRAVERFEKASVANPKAAGPHFHRAQALLAAGSYAEAVAAVRAGLALDPAWPASLFDPKEPYGAGAVRFAEHLAELRTAAAANPDEPTLQFLLGYQLWFIGEKAEARKWFAAAEKRLANPEVIALFK